MDQLTVVYFIAVEVVNGMMSLDPAALTVGLTTIIGLTSVASSLLTKEV